MVKDRFNNASIKGLVETSREMKQEQHLVVDGGGDGGVLVQLLLDNPVDDRVGRNCVGPNLRQTPTPMLLLLSSRLKKLHNGFCVTSPMV